MKKNEPDEITSDPDYKEFVERARLMLIASVDLRGSTFLKYTSASKAWIIEIVKFYYDFQTVLQFAYSDVPEYVKEAPFATERQLMAYKLKGDEILFQVRLERHEQALFHIQALKTAVRNYNADANENTLKVKATSWLCGLPVTDSRIRGLYCEDEGQARRPDSHQLVLPLDFVGPSMDIGFRIADYAKARKLVVSYDLAIMLIDALRKSEGLSRQKRALHFYYDHSVSLKGVLGGFPYPIIWVNIYDADPAPEERLRGMVREPCDLDELKAFCISFRKEHGLPNWFIPTDTDVAYHGPDPMWLTKFKAYKTQLAEADLDIDRL